MLSFSCEELKTLPTMTLRGSCQTALELRSKFHITRFSLDFDNSLPEGHLQVSSDLYHEILHFLIRDKEARREPVD
jgi:hypothetical protein